MWSAGRFPWDPVGTESPLVWEGGATRPQEYWSAPTTVSNTFSSAILPSQPLHSHWVSDSKHAGATGTTTAATNMTSSSLSSPPPTQAEVWHSTDPLLPSIAVNGATAKGLRPYQEDRWTIIRDSKSDVLAAIVADGHGGSIVSQYLKDHLPDQLFPMCRALQETKPYVSWQKLQPWIQETIQDILESIDQTLYRDHDHIDRGGSTLVVVLMFPTIRKTITINVGDSLIVLGSSDGTVAWESRPHKPNDPAETKRIEHAGGVVVHDGATYRVNRILALSRAVGDTSLKLSLTGNFHPTQGPVSIAPDVTCFDDLYSWILLVSDGLSDVMTASNMLSIVTSMHNRHIFPADALVQEAYTRRSQDNLTALVLSL
jgi:serine/threonine protein phosphatase PrpC